MIFVARWGTIVISAVLVFCLCLSVFPEYTKAAPNSAKVVIYQLQTGSQNGATQEYVSIYNNTEESIDVTGWCLIYSSASGISQSDLGCIKPSPDKTNVFLDAYQSIQFASSEFIQANPNNLVKVIFNPGMSGSSGHVKIVDSHKAVVDSLGWGSASQPEGLSTAAHSLGNILQRIRVVEDVLQDINNNVDDFEQKQLTIPQSSGWYEQYVEPEGDYSGLVISEILPNAKGADVGSEFLEFYNSASNALNLKNYRLQLGPSYSKTFTLPDVNIEPGFYVSLSDFESGVTLPNTKASVRIIDRYDQIVYETWEYIHVDEGAAWALFGEVWEVTYIPTPGSGNELQEAKPCPEGQVRSEETGYCKSINNIEESDSPAPCRSDQERNPLTNRCRKISTISALSLCKPGQVRNPDTGRCRSISSKNSTPTPCKAGQERSPTTNRCRKIVVAKEIKPCPAGQERNTQTNRCRKVSKATSLIDKNVKDVPAALVANNIKWWLAGIASLSSVSYGAYEWRREVFSILNAIKAKILPG